MFKDLAHRTTLVELCQKRDQCLALIAHAEKALNDAGELLPGRYGLSVEIEHSRSSQDVNKAIDRQFWRHALDLTGFRQIMDAAAVSDWERDVEGPKCPPFTEDTVISTFLAAAQNAGEMFDRGVYRVFQHLDYSYRSNTRDAFKIEADKRYVMSYWIETWNRPSVSHRRCDQLNDIDRIVRTVLGEKFEPRALESAMNAQFREGKDYECAVYKARAFRNGNMHFWIKDSTAVDGINEAIHRHTNGSAIPRDHAA